MLPMKYLVILDYFLNRREILHLDHPVTFSEKIQWAKVFGHIDKYSPFVDKYEVRAYVAATVGEKYLVPLYGIWEKPENIPFESLPKPFVLKGTHGCGYVTFCRNASDIQRHTLEKLCNIWLNQDFSREYGELQYHACKPKIIAEKLLEDPSGELKDYKIYCFHGVPRYIHVDENRHTNHTRNIMDTSWRWLPVSLLYTRSKNPSKKPMNLRGMLKISKMLSRPFPFVRVDLYSIGSKIYFGELTFTPGNGMRFFRPSEFDKTLGGYIEHTQYPFLRNSPSDFFRKYG